MQIEDIITKNKPEQKTDKAASFIASYGRTDALAGMTAGVAGTDQEKSTAKTDDTLSQGIRLEKGQKNRQASLYNKKSLKTAAEAYEKQVQTGAGEKNIQNEMVLAAHTMSKADYKEMAENGFDPADTDAKTFVTIADKIRIQLSKAGKDMSITGGVSKTAIEAVSGSAAEANAIEGAVKQSSGEADTPEAIVSETIKSLESADLPTDTDTRQQVTKTVSKAAELPERLGQAEALYLTGNGLDPTVDNLLKATFAGTTDISGQTEISDADMNQLIPQLNEKIESAGLPQDENQLNNAILLLKNDIPVTEENLVKFDQLNGATTIQPEELPQAVTDAVKEGNAPYDAMAVRGFSAMDKARDAVEVVNTATDEDVETVVLREKPLTVRNLRDAEAERKQDNGSEKQASDSRSEELKVVSAKRQLEETRLVMTTEANFQLIRRGVSIDTTDLSEMVEELKKQERTLGQALFPDDDIRAGLFDDVTDTLTEAEGAPAALLSAYRHPQDIFSVDIREIAKGEVTLGQMKKAADVYETLYTNMKPYHNESIEEAFSNIDDILDDAGIEKDDENRRAVRILAYNGREVTKENVAGVRAADQKVQQVFRNMTPGVVMQMVKKGQNPLKMPLDQLLKKTEDIKKVMASNGSEADRNATDYADFLWKATQSGKVTDEEKESYIGLYRLLHQVDVSDGAPIGALISQGTEITMENLMMAIRSRRNEGKDFIIDDNFTAPDSVINNSITDQISSAYNSRWDEILREKHELNEAQQEEKEFNTRRVRDAKALVTPDRLNAMGGKKAYMPMSPDELATTLEKMDRSAQEQQTDEKLYSQRQSEIEKTFAESDENTYRILNDAGMAASAINVQAVNEVIKNHRFFYTRLYGKNGRQTFDGVSENLAEGSDMTLDSAWDKLINDFSDALETPEEMAKAQQELYDTAENVLRRSLVDDAAAGKIDIKLIQQSVRQLAVMKELSEKREEYAIPVMVGDELGNMNLKIVRGKDEKKGIVDLSLSSDITGDVYARFRAEKNGSISGKITTDSIDSRRTLSENLEVLAGKIHQKLNGGSVSLITEYDGRTDSTAVFYSTDEPGFETTDDRTSAVQTKMLYGIAKSFVETVGELFE